MQCKILHLILEGLNYHPGDGDIIASFSDGTVTGDDWRAQTFYISPIYDLSCLTEENNVRGSVNCKTEGDENGENTQKEKASQLSLATSSDDK